MWYIYPGALSGFHSVLNVIASEASLAVPEIVKSWLARGLINLGGYRGIYVARCLRAIIRMFGRDSRVARM